jgi:hypothetical protein
LAGLALAVSNGGSSLAGLWQHPGNLPKFLLALLGIPFHFVGLPDIASFGLGFLGLLLAASALWLIHSVPKSDAPDRQLLPAPVSLALTAWLLFGLATLVLITLGRAGLNDQIPFDEKYFPCVALVWASSILLIGSFHRPRRIMMWAALASIWILIPRSQESVLWNARWFRRSTEPLMAAAQFGSESPTIARFSGVAAPNLVVKAYQNRWNSFSYPDLRDLGWDLGQRLDNQGNCTEGATEGAEQIINGYRLHGWGDQLTIDERERRVLITTVAPKPYVIGWGTFVAPRGEVSSPFRHLLPPDLVTWEAYIDPRARGSVQAWAVSLKAREACSLGPPVVLP